MTNELSSDPSRLAQQLLAATNSMSDDEAARRYQQILAQLPRDEAAKLNALAMTQVNADQRRSLASGFKQATQDPSRPFDGYDYDDDDEAASPVSLGKMSAQAANQDPALVNNLLGGDNSGLGGRIGKAALAALAAILIRKLMSGQGQQPGTVGQPMAGGADPLSMILGSLLGGAGGGMSQGAPAGGDLGSILGGLLGGGQPAPGGRGQQVPAGDLGSILGGLLGGGQPMPGGAGQQLPTGGIDLGSILGGVLGGGQPTSSGRGQPMPAGGIDLGSILGSILSGAGGGSGGGGGGGSFGDAPPRSHRKD